MLLGIAATSMAAGSSSTQGSRQYVVILKSGNDKAGLDAIAAAGGKVERSNKVGVVTASTKHAKFAERLRASRKVDAVGANSYFYEATPTAAAQEPAPADPVATGCAQQYQPPGGTGVGPDPLSVCQWDMRISNASPTGSYAVNRGRGATVGIIDTGIDLEHEDIAENLDVGLSCSFIRPNTPTSLPQEWESSSNCSTKTAVQDYNGHGTHVGGEVAAPINGFGVAGVAPEATLVGLKAGTAEGYFFTQAVTDALIYAGDKRLDVVNMSFFADPWLFNCHNDKDQQAIIKAISRAASYANQRGVVLVGSAGNEQQDLDHPGVDDVSPDYPPGSEQERDVGNSCVVLPAELPWTTTVSSIGPQKRLAFYSSYGNSKVDVTAAGGSSDQAPEPYGRVLNAWSSTAGPVSSLPGREVEHCGTVGGAPACARYGWIQGTSMASPHAAGVAALIRSANPGMPPMAVQARLQNTAMPMSCPTNPSDARCKGGGQTNFYGNGLVDALAAGRG
jgi:subtilisin family serine protease